MAQHTTWVRLLAILLFVGWTASACGPAATSPPPTQQPTSAPTMAAVRGRCGDGVCDQAEQADPSLCPQDCVTPEPTPKEACGDGVCDDREQANPDLCPQDCVTPEPPPKEACGDGLCDEREQQDRDLCPQDCEEAAPGGPPAGDEQPQVDDVTPSPTLTPTPSPGRARVKLQWSSFYGGCQGDYHTAEMEFTLSLTADGGLAGSGNGTMSAQSVQRCPDTDYGGHRTPAPYPVTVKGTPTDSGWTVELLAQDFSQFYRNTAGVYATECRLCWLVPQFKGLGVSGTLSSFSLPRELRSGDTFRFEVDYQVGEGHHFGEGTLEIVAVPQ